MKKILTIALLAAISPAMHAQLVDVINEVTYEGPLLPAGYTCYRIYARTQDPTDRISAVFGQNVPSPMHHLILGSTAEEDEILNHQFGGILGSDLNCALWSFLPELRWDSYVTIGRTNSSNGVGCNPDATPDCAGSAGTVFSITNPAGSIGASFNFSSADIPPFWDKNHDLFIVDGSWFVANDGSCNGFPQPPDNRILLAQMTVPTGTLFYQLNIAMFDEGVGANQLIYVHTLQDPPGFVGTIPEIDGTCLGLVYPLNGYCDVYGCTDPSACNYYVLSTIDDGSCSYVDGCNDPLACNYDSEAVCNNNCIYPGCGDPTACNYNPDAYCNDDGLCCYLTGCNISTACNYVPNACCFVTCVFPGCTDPLACNYNPNAGCESGSCIYPSNFGFKGHIYHDANGNGFYNTGFFDEPTIANWPLFIVELGVTIYSDNNGYYQINNLPPGTYTVQVLDNSSVWNPVNTSYTVTVNGCQIITLNIPLALENQTMLQVSGPCCIWMMNIHCQNGFNPGLWVHNTGSMPLNGTFTITCNELFTAVPLSGTIPFDEFVPGTITWHIENQQPGTSKIYQCHINGPGVDYIGQFFPFDLHFQLVDDESNVIYDNNWVLNPMVVCAYDPNDKYAEPGGIYEEHFILNEDRIEYRIRFQNTGNAPAEDILIQDVIDTDVLDLDTFEPIFASANFYTCLHDDGLVEFFFNDINLPDSTTDEPGSQGYVVFRISPYTSLTHGTLIHNTASIIFDGNPPIVTNTTWHTIFDCNTLQGIEGNAQWCEGSQMSFSAAQPYVEQYQWTLNEEPLSTEAQVSLDNLQAGDYTLSLQVSNPLCTRVSQTEIEVFALPEAEIVQDGALLTASPAASYQWYFNGEAITGATGQSYMATAEGYYHVSVISAQGCGSTSGQVLVVRVSEATGTPVVIYPNPARDQTTVLLPQGLWQIQVWNEQGKMIYDAAALQQRAIIQTNAWPAGNYMIQLTDDKGFRLEAKLMVK